MPLGGNMAHKVIAEDRQPVAQACRAAFKRRRALEPCGKCHSQAAAFEQRSILADGREVIVRLITDGVAGLLDGMTQSGFDAADVALTAELGDEAPAGPQRLINGSGDGSLVLHPMNRRV